MLHEIELMIPALHPGQQQVRNEAVRFNVVDCGRRWGKTALGVDLMIDTALNGQPVAWFSPTYRMLSEVWRETAQLLRRVSTRVAASEHRIDLVTGGAIDMWSLDSADAPRGRKYARGVVDEAAMIRDLEYAWTNVIRPALADFAGDAWFMSTPKGLNYFHTLYERGQGKDKDWRSWRFPTATNPYIRQSEIDAMRAELPQRVYEQEIEAAFVEDGAYFRNVNACATIDESESVEAHKGHKIVAGVDWGNQDDFTVMTVFCCQCNRVVDWDRTNQIGYEHQRARIANLNSRWHPEGILPERNSIGLPNIELLVSEGMPILNGPDGQRGFNTLPTTKPQLIQDLALAIERKTITVPRDYASELMAYELKMTESGRQTFSAPRNLHDDRVMSLALAFYAASHARVQLWI